MVFCFVQNFFFRTTRELEYFFFLSRKARIFFPEFNIMLYDKHSESDYFFSSTKIRIVFSATLGNHIPPFKLNGRSLSWQDKTCLEYDNDKIVLQILFCANSSNVIHQQTWWFMVIYGDLWWFMVRDYSLLLRLLNILLVIQRVFNDIGAVVVVIVW
jgi:hypothetical protein